MEEKILICEYSGLPSLLSYDFKKIEMENTLSCCYVSKIDEIMEIPGADNIEQARIGGWNCIIQKNQFKVGENVIVATTDAMIPVELATEMNVVNYLRKGTRVRTVKLKGVYSECLLIPFKFAPKKEYEVGKDMMEIMGIQKYEPPVKMIQLSSGKKIRYSENPNFLIYYKFPNQKNVPEMFNTDDLVQITRKIHGTNARYGIVKKHKLTFWDKVKKFFKVSNQWIDFEFVVGSHNVEKGSDSQGFYDTNVWYEIADKYNIKEKMWNFVKKLGKDTIGSNFVIYGEIYGNGIQKGYDYGLKDMEFVGFDLMIDGEYQNQQTTDKIIRVNLELPHVPVLFIGYWSKEIQDSYVFNNNISGTKIPHEGVVVKTLDGKRDKISKVINPDYLIYSEKNHVGDSH
jgi:RNA ligase (TIGR02306 family)